MLVIGSDCYEQDDSERPLYGIRKGMNILAIKHDLVPAAATAASTAIFQEEQIS